MSVAIPYIAAEYKLAAWQSGAIMSAFFASYSLAQIPGGILADKLGVRKVATVALLWWSAFTAATGAAANFTQMMIVRFVFGLGEGVFPACAFKSIAVWFPKRERATANAIKFAAAPLGAALAPLFVVAVMSAWGWRHVFMALFIPGALIAVLLWKFVSDNPAESKRVDAAELVEIEDGEGAVTPNEPATKLTDVLKQPSIVKYFCALFSFNIAYWGFTTWLPTYLIKARGFSLVEMGFAASLPFATGVIGCIVGGWISDRYFSRYRKLPIIAAQLISAVLLYLSFVAESATTLVLCQALAGFFLHLHTSAFWALPMNTIPRRMMGVASGAINMAGQAAAFTAPILIGYLVSLADGHFGLTFAALISALVLACAIVLTIPSRQAN